MPRFTLRFFRMKLKVLVNVKKRLSSQLDVFKMLEWERTHACVRDEEEK